MVAPLLTTKLRIPLVRPGLVFRPPLVDRLDAGCDRKLTLVSVSTGFGRLSERPQAWICRSYRPNGHIRRMSVTPARWRGSCVILRFFVFFDDPSRTPPLFGGIGVTSLN